MKPDQLADLLLSWQNQPDFEQRIRELAPELTLPVIEDLKKRGDAQLFSHPRLSLKIAQTACAVAAIMAEPESQALAIWALGNGLNMTNRYAAAIKAYQEAGVFYAAEGRSLETARLWANQAGVYLNLGEYQAALELAYQAQDAYTKLGPAAQRYLPALEMNVGVAHKSLGNFNEALAAYERGRAVWLALGNLPGAARFDLNRANVLEQMDRLAEAEPLYHCARQVLEEHDYQSDVARADLNLGLLAWHRGEYQISLRYLDAAYQSYTAAKDLTEIAVVNLHRSLVYSQLNFLEDAIQLGSQAERRLKRHKVRTYRAIALENLGLAYQRLKIYAVAAQKLTLARNLFRRQGAQARANRLDLRLAQLALEAGDMERAGQLAHKLEARITATIMPADTVQLQLLQAQSALHQCDAPQAGRLVRSALELAEQYGLPEIASAYYLAGQIHEQAREDPAALTHYERAIQSIERLKALLGLDEFQMGFMHDKLSIYMAAVRICQRAGHWGQTLFLLNLAQLAPLPQTGLNAKTDPQLYEMRATWRRYQSLLEKADDPQSLTPSTIELDQWRKKQRELEFQIADLTYRRRAETLLASSPEIEPELSNAPGFIAQLQSCLHPGEGLLHYYVVEDALHVIFVSRGSLHCVSQLIPAAKMERLQHAWRYCIEHWPEPLSATLEIDPPQHAEVLPFLARMYQALVEPLHHHLVDCTRLFLVLPPAYHDLPWAAFFDGKQYLVEHFELIHLSTPSALFHSNLRNPAPTSILPTALIVGCSDQGRLAYVPVEARQVEAVLREGWQTRLLIDAEATLAKIRQHSQTCHLIHFATHAVFRNDNPLFSWMRLADGDLTVHELGELRLTQAPLVVLSACETGRGKARGGGLIGMGRGFLLAGASGLVVSLWKMNDQACAQWMVDFYRQPISAPAAALRQAQRNAVREGQSPYFWAGFIFIGG